MIPEPYPDDPDDPSYRDLNDDLGYLVPDRSQRNDLIDPLDPLEL